MSRSTLITLIFLIFILIVVGWFAWKSLKKDPEVSAIAAPAVEAFVTNASTTAYVDFAGNPANLDQHIGDVIVAHSWATWVPSSKQSLRDLEKLQLQYADSNVTVLAINRGEADRTVRQFLEHLSVKNLKIVSDSDDHYFKTIEGRAMPETIFYDANGNIVHHESGKMTFPEMQVYTDKAVADSEKVRQN